MAEVTGFIGQETVSLNNAATEATLKAILLALAGSQEKMNQMMALAGKAGLDNKAIEDANAAVAEEAKVVRQLTEDELKRADQIKAREQSIINRFQKLDQTIVSLMDGTATASGIFKTIGDQLPGVLGAVVTGMSRLLAIQEQNFVAYQQLTQNGISFGGSLTLMRQSAANAYLTLDQFQNVLKNNSQMLAMLGGTADKGAVAFAKMNGELMQSEAGRHLQALGYTAEDVAGGMANYLTMSGGRSGQELKNTKAITDASAQYMEQLDGLARITGESRQQQQDQMKAQAANAAWQAKLAGMSEAEKAKMTAGLANALAVGGKGAADAYQSKILGIPPISQEAKIFTATMGEANNAIMKSADVAMDSSKSMADLNETFFDAANGIQVDLSQFSEETKAALIAQGGPMGAAIQAAQEHANKFGKQTDEQRREAMAKQQRENTEAGRMSDAMRSLKELGAQLWDVFSPLLTAVSYVAVVFGGIVSVLSAVIGGFNSLLNSMGGLGTFIKGALVVWALYAAAQRMATAEMRLKMGAGDLLGKMGGRVGGFFGGGAPAAASPAGALAGGAGAAGGGIGGAISGLLTSLAEGMKKLGNPQVMMGAVTLGLLAGTLWIASKGLENFAKVSWESMGKGFVTLLGLGALAAVLSFAAPFIVGGAIAIGALGLAMIPLGIASKGLENFAKISWESIGKGFATLLGLGALAAVLSFAAPFIVGGAIAIGALGLAMIPFGIAVSLAGPQMQNLAKGLIMLQDVSALSLMAVGVGIVSLSGSLMALGVGAGIAGLTVGTFTQIVNGLDKLNKMDPSKLLAISKSMKDIGANLKDVGGGGIFDKVSGLASKLNPFSSGPTAKDSKGDVFSTGAFNKEFSDMDKEMGGAGASGSSGALNTSVEKMNTHLESLNNTMSELLRHTRDTSENTKKTHEATKSLNGNLF